jgi:hypothetical protein
MTRSAFSQLQFASTNVYQQLNDQLIIVVRSWGSSEYNQKLVDEITHYLSTTQADIEVTTPFDYQESLSSLANRTRVAMLLAHDLFYKTDNKNEYVVGFESLVLFRSKNEVAWSSVGRFSIAKLHNGELNYLNRCGTDLDIETLMPAELMGLEKEINVHSGSFSFGTDSKVVVASTFNCELTIADASSISSLVEVNTGDKGAYWVSVVTEG